MTTPIRLMAIIFMGFAFVIGSGSTATAATVVVDVGDLWFCDSSFQNGVCTTTINVGDTVTWNFDVTATPHTSTDCDGDCDNAPFGVVWDSTSLSNGTFSEPFNQAGTFAYYCSLHPILMRGEIVVNGGVDDVGGIAELPSTSTGPIATEDSSGLSTLLLAAIAAATATAAVSLTGAAWYAKKRWAR